MNPQTIIGRFYDRNFLASVSLCSSSEANNIINNMEEVSNVNTYIQVIQELVQEKTMSRSVLNDEGSVHD